ncbi:MAG: shikimate kinase [Ferruginibacter sp.]|nr:shikimate kinase [Cytophagales bacterium]
MKNIFLVGMPTSGKSSLGKALANQLDYQFLDLDELIVEREGVSIAEIFRRHGEAYFRQSERALLRSIVPNSRLVVATGGGTPCFFDNMSFIHANGLSLFMDVSPRELLRRLKDGRKNERPLFNVQADASILLAGLEKKYEERRIFYQQAHYSIQDDRIDLRKLLEVIKAETLR